MSRSPLFAAVLLGLTLASPARTASPLLDDRALASLSDSLRACLIQAIPTPLIESKQNWGHTKKVQRLHWRGKGLHVHPETEVVDRNDGVWRRVRIMPVNLPGDLTFALRNPKQTTGGALTFDAVLAFHARLEHERQNWTAGTRVYSGCTRARFRVVLNMKCEVASRLEKSGSFVPDVVFRLRVLQADLNYDQLVCEHVAGLGGEAANLLGQAAKDALHAFHPGLERDLLAKANAAIVKAGDTKEVRISLGKLLK